jgi:hypothetical protein
VTRVRTTLRPDLEIEVDGAEHLDLQRMGLLVEDAPAVEATPPVVPQPRTSTPDKPGKEE